MTIPNPNYLPKAPSPNTITLGVRASTYELNIKWLKIAKRVLDGFGEGPTPKYLGQSPGGAGSGKQMKCGFSADPPFLF